MPPSGDRITEKALGKWRGILVKFGMPSSYLTGKHGPCPMCGGRDRWRFDDKERRGTWICSQCGAGDGWKLLSLWKGWDFKAAMDQVRPILGELREVEEKPKFDPKDTRQWLRDMWVKSSRVEGGDFVATYLASRGLSVRDDLRGLRCIAEISWKERNTRRYVPGMLALVTDHRGTAVTLHRTFLKPKGLGRMEGEGARKMMPGRVPEGSAVRLFDAAPHMGIGEGIETCLAASELFGIPVWSALNSHLLKSWIVPAGVERVTVFGDNDGKFGGQAAAYLLAHRLACDERRPMTVDVKIPVHTGHDWNDVLLAQKERAA